MLDNFEHLAPAAPSVAALLEALPELRVLVTSQAPLRVAAERRMPLDALDDDAALALMDRVARRRGAASPLDGGDRDALLDVVHLLDGLPLALELAAARLALLSPVQLRERLRASPDVLQDTGADRADRQRSLRATVEWTVGQLDDGPRALFLRMGAFAGPVELEDLEAVAGGDGLDVLEALAGCSTWRSRAAWSPATAGCASACRRPCARSPPAGWTPTRTAIGGAAPTHGARRTSRGPRAC